MQISVLSLVAGLVFGPGDGVRAGSIQRREFDAGGGIFYPAVLGPDYGIPTRTRWLVGNTCGQPSVTLAPDQGGRSRIAIASACRAGELVSLSYADATFVERLDGEGRSESVLDCFAGTVPISIAFEDGTKVTRAPSTDDLSRYSKVAIIWSSSVDLDLHAFEYAAPADEPGHIWSGHSSSLQEASEGVKEVGRGRGFLSTASRGTAIGMNVEVYTFVHHPGQVPGGIKIAVDYATRGARADGEHCGTGHFAEIHFKAHILERGRVVRSLDLAFASVPCGTELSGAARLNSRLIPELMIRGAE